MEQHLEQRKRDERATLEPSVVELELLISPTGSVISAQAISGADPFSTAATTQASSWLFAPATRDGVPVSAKIRLQVTFTPPVIEVLDDPPAEATPPIEVDVRTPAPDAPAPINVVVVGERTVGVKKLGRAEVRQMPGAFGDPYRAIEALPGVTPIVSGLPYFFVRGAPPGNVGYFFDDVTVPLLYHVAAGPGVLHPAFVDSVNLYSGAYPVRYGRYAGGIVAGDAASPEGRFRGEASIRLIDSGAFVEVPFDEGKGSAMFGGRYSYTGLVISLLAEDISLGYWDYQSKVSYQLNPEETVSLFAFGSHDYLSADDSEGVSREILDLTFHRVNARYTRELDPLSTLGLQLSFGFERTGIGSENEDDEPPGDLSTKSLGGRVSLDHELGPALKLRSGADANFSRLAIVLNTGDDSVGGDGPDAIGEMPGPPPSVEDDGGGGNDEDEEAFEATFGFSRNDIVAGLWTEAVWLAAPHVTVTPGLRFDVYDAGGSMEFTLEPRIAARFDLNPSLSLVHDFGLAHQPPSFAIPIPGLAGSAGSGMQQAIQSSAGVEMQLPAQFTGSATVFQNVILNSTDVFGTANLGSDGSDNNPFLDRPTNHSYGLELYVKRSLAQRLGGFLSYTLSRSTRTIPRLSGVSSFDRSHVVNAALAFDLGRRWRLGVRTLAYSGIPARVAYLEAAKSPPRTPWFYRIDWRLEKRWLIGTDGAWWALVFEALNTTLNKEVLQSSCYAYGCKDEAIGPVTIPSIGAEASF